MKDRRVRGAGAGLLATLPMTLVIAAARATGLLRTPPPAQITRNAAARAGVPARAGSTGFRVGWLAAHAGFGAASGVGYALVRPLLPKRVGIAGLLYGLALWVLAYVGVMPALRLYPWPGEDSRSRGAVMIAAHAVFGLALAETDRRLATAQNRHSARHDDAWKAVGRHACGAQWRSRSWLAR